jgi:hypothetical protein
MGSITYESQNQQSQQTMQLDLYVGQLFME